MNRTALLFALLALLLTLPPISGNLRAEETFDLSGAYEGISRDDWNSLWNKAISSKNKTVVDEGSIVAVELPLESAIYFFTKPGHPAHPAIVKRYVTQEDGAIYIGSQGWAGGSRAEFEDWFILFLKQDEKIRRQFQ